MCSRKDERDPVFEKSESCSSSAHPDRQRASVPSGRFQSIECSIYFSPYTLPVCPVSCVWRSRPPEQHCQFPTVIRPAMISPETEPEITPTVTRGTSWGGATSNGDTSTTSDILHKYYLYGVRKHPHTVSVLNSAGYQYTVAGIKHTGAVVKFHHEPPGRYVPYAFKPLWSSGSIQK